jgi:hypothetical protein
MPSEAFVAEQENKNKILKFLSQFYFSECTNSSNLEPSTSTV